MIFCGNLALLTYIVVVTCHRSTLGARVTVMLKDSCGCNSVVASPAQPWDTAAVWVEMGSAPAAAKQKLIVSRCHIIELLSVRKPNKSAGFQARASYCVSEAHRKEITIMNDNGGETNIPVDSWMKRWVLAGELQAWGEGCAIPLAFSCVKNIDQGSDPVSAVTLSTDVRESLLTPDICNAYRNKGSSERTTTMKQVKGANGCDEFNVYDQTETGVPILSWMPKRKQPFSASGCASADWSAQPQRCITLAFHEWQSQRNFRQLRNAFCGPNSDEYVPCWLGDA